MFAGQRRTQDVMNYLSKEALNGKVKSILFLTPCHATPYYSTLHRNIPMHFLDCFTEVRKLGMYRGIIFSMVLLSGRVVLQVQFWFLMFFLTAKRKVS